MKKYVMITIIIIGTLGALALAVATYISTVKIVNIDNELSDATASVDKFEFDAVMAGICKLDYNSAIAQKQFNLFQRNYLVIENKGEEAREFLAQQALKDAIGLAKSWATLLSEDKADTLSAATDKKISNILENGQLSTLGKLSKVEGLWKENEILARERIKLKNEKWQIDKAKKVTLEKEKLQWHKIFVLCQVAGLLMLAIAGIVEGSTKISTTLK